MPDANPWFQLAGPVVVAVSTLAAVGLTQYWTVRREREARRHESEEQKKQQEVEQRRRSLIDLQEAMTSALRAVRESALETLNSQVDPNADGPKRVAASDNVYVALARADCLRQRIQDEQLRSVIESAINAINAAKTPSSIEEHRKSHDIMTRKFQIMNDRIGDFYRADMKRDGGA